MAKLRIITNNPMAKAKYKSLAEFHGSGGVLGVFTACRDAVHMGAALISHPLAGSVKPNINPYKSVVLSSEKPGTDLSSLQIIEDALAVLRKLGERAVNYGGAAREFQLIDLELLDSAMASLRNGYYA